MNKVGFYFWKNMQIIFTVGENDQQWRQVGQQAIDQSNMGLERDMQNDESHEIFYTYFDNRASTSFIHQVSMPKSGLGASSTSSKNIRILIRFMIKRKHAYFPVHLYKSTSTINTSVRICFATIVPDYSCSSLRQISVTLHSKTFQFDLQSIQG